jgi:hypothetical protein
MDVARAGVARTGARWAGDVVGPASGLVNNGRIPHLQGCAFQLASHHVGHEPVQGSPVNLTQGEQQPNINYILDTFKHAEETGPPRVISRLPCELTVEFACDPCLDLANNRIEWQIAPTIDSFRSVGEGSEK